MTSFAAVGCLALALFVGACGGGDSSDGSASSGESTGEGNAGTASAAAAKVIEPYVGQPSAFPVPDKLKEVPNGATIAYVSCGTPICALLGNLLTEASEVMGVNLTVTKAGSAANQVSSAYDSVVAQKPDAVIAIASNMELWSRQLEQLQEADIPVVTSGNADAEEYGIISPQASNNSSELAGHLMANYVVAEFSPEANIAVYELPELPFSPIVTESFVAELEKICADCSVRTVQIPVAAIGNTAPDTIVSDLQSNPETTLAVFSVDETQLGLPAALKAAGIEVETLGYSPAPYNLQYVKEGTETAVLAFDVPVLAWTLVDQAAREIVGQELTGPQAEGLPVNQFLTKEDITFDPSKGWTGYPDFAERFAKLWGVGG